MSAKQPTADMADIDAWFAGDPIPTAKRPYEAGKQGRTASNRYSRCALCGHMGPLLLTFQGSTSWQGQLTDDDAVRLVVNQLKRRDQSATVLLCTYCVTDIQTFPEKAGFHHGAT